MTHDLLRYARESATALREAQAEIERIRAELEAAKCLSKHAVECMDRCCPQCNAAMKEKA